MRIMGGFEFEIESKFETQCDPKLHPKIAPSLKMYGIVEKSSSKQLLAHGLILFET